MKNQLKTIGLLGALSALLIGAGTFIAPAYVYVFGVLAIAMNIGAYFFSDRLILRMHHAREVSPAEAPGLHRMVEELAANAGIPTPRLFVIPESQPNAFATGRNPAHGVVAVTEGIVEILTERELRGVIAHEIAHIRNRDILIASVAATVASAISSIANVASFGALFGASRNDEEHGSPIGALAMAFVAPVAATLIQLGISRSREFVADETGARISGDADALAAALLKLERAAQVQPVAAAPATASLFIVNPFGSMARAARLFSTHPPTAERVVRLRALSQETPVAGYVAARREVSRHA